jgi:hypothetical protein
MAILRRLLLLLVVCTGVGVAALSSAQPAYPGLFGGMRWRLVGPFRAGAR